MTSFQGYARRSSVSENTIKVHDPSEKILAESRKVLQQWRARSSAEQQSRQAYQDALSQNFRKEQSVRDSNRRLEKEFAENWRAARAKNWEISIQNAENKIKHAKPPLLEQLSDFSATLAKSYKQIDQQRQEAGRTFGMRLGLEHGLTMEHVLRYDTIKSQLSKDDTTYNAFIKELREQGVSEYAINRLGGISGYQRLGLQEYTLVKAKDAYEAHLQDSEIRSKLHTLANGQELSLDTAAFALNSPAHREILSKISDEYLGKFAKNGYDAELVIKHLRDPVLNANKRRTSELQANTEKQLKQDVEDNYIRDMTVAISNDDVAGYFNFIDRHSGVDGKDARNGHAIAHQTIMRMAEEGQLNSEFMQRLFEHTYTPRGETRLDKEGEPIKVLWGEQHHKKVKEVITAYRKGQLKLQKKRDADLAMDATMRKVRVAQADALLVENYGKLTQADYGKARAAALNAGYHEVAKRIEARSNTTPQKINDTHNVPGLQDLYNKNLLTKSAVINAKLTPETEATWLTKAAEQDKTVPSKETIKFFEGFAESAIQGKLKKFEMTIDQVPSARVAQLTARNALFRYYKKLVIDGQPPESARDLAVSQLNADLDSKLYSLSERRTVGGVLMIEPHFPEFQITASRSPYPYTKLRKDIVNNPNIWREEIVVPSKETLQWAYNVSAGINKGYPAAYSHIVNNIIGNNPDGTPKITEAELARHQLELIVGKEKANELIPDEIFGVARKASEQFHKDFRKLLRLGPEGQAVAVKFGKYLKPNSDVSKYRVESSLSNNAKTILNPKTKSYAHPVLKEREENPGPLGSRSNPWPEGTPAWQIGGFNSEADYNEAVKKDPSIKEILE